MEEAEAEERPQKRIKITASNGWRVPQEMKNNRVDKMNTVSKSAPRCGTKGKLARLVAMPLDLLFEVCPCLYLLTRFSLILMRLDTSHPI
jgi:hypothetical protein